MWILLPGSELRHVADSSAIVANSENVAIEQGLPEGGVKETVIVHTRSRAEAKGIVEDLARQIENGATLLRVPAFAQDMTADDREELEGYFDMGEPVA